MMRFVVVGLFASLLSTAAQAQFPLNPDRTIYVANSAGRIQAADIATPTTFTEVTNVAGYAAIHAPN